MKTALMLLFICCFNLIAFSQFTEPAEIPNGIKNTPFADVIAAKANSTKEGFSLTVTIESPDKGCNQYADWWEVLDEDRQLMYRRILTHSHVAEQPFSRNGESVLMNESQNIWIIAHMNNAGYGGISLFGSVKNGFRATALPEDFDASLARQTPLPTGCDF
ncbi:MAG: hypothetical protein ACI8QD_002817 [Cyclobacteriaceae bacterium]|jgi:hypothetical protein